MNIKREQNGSLGDLVHIVLRYPEDEKAIFSQWLLISLIEYFVGIRIL